MAREPEKSGRESGKAKAEGAEETKASGAEKVAAGANDEAGRSTGLTQFQNERRNELRSALARRSEEGADVPAIVREFAALWLPYHSVEVEMLVPALEDADVDKEKMAAVGVRKDMLNLLLGDLLQTNQDEAASAKLEALAEQLEGVFEASRQEAEAMAEAMDEDSLKALGPQMKARYERVKKRFADIEESLDEATGILAPRRLSLSTFRRAGRREMRMSDRDERGRVASDEERGYSRGGRFRSRYEDEDEGRYGGRRSMSREREDEDERRFGGRGRGRGRWYGDPEGHAEAARRGWDRSGHGESGWYGDPEGHSEAARRGWEEGRRAQRRDEEDDRARSRSRYEDEERRYEGRRGRYEDERYGRNRGRGGWSGDPEGHSEAARRGWEHRR